MPIAPCAPEIERSMTVRVVLQIRQGAQGFIQCHDSFTSQTRRVFSPSSPTSTIHPSLPLIVGVSFLFAEQDIGPGFAAVQSSSAGTRDTGGAAPNAQIGSTCGSAR